MALVAKILPFFLEWLQIAPSHIHAYISKKNSAGEDTFSSALLVRLQLWRYAFSFANIFM